MPLLSCTARTCVYNKDEYCSKGDILVEGRSATAADETSCSSFKERSRDTVSDAACYDCGCRTIDVDCKAQKCTFNREEKCHADKITITGSAATRSADTKCGSFELER